MPLNSLSLSQKSTALPDDFSQVKTLVDLVRYQSFKHPTKTAFVFLEDGERESIRLSYQELDQQARKVAVKLQSLKAKGERALLLYPQSIEVIIAFCGCLYAGVIGIPVPAPESDRLKRTLPRLRAIIKDAQARLALTTDSILASVGNVGDEFPELSEMNWIITEKLDLDSAQHWQDPQVNADHLAYLQYTSGSTATPKGVMLSHFNVIHHLSYLQKACGYNPDSVTLTWMPYFHDYGLVEGMMVPLFNGTPCYLMSPFAFLKRPIQWLRNITRFKVTHSQAPNFAYDFCTRKVQPDDLQSLDLSSWQGAGNAAEPISTAVLSKFVEIFEPCGFRWESFAPAYGLAEYTLLVSTKPKGKKPVIAVLQAKALEQGKIVQATLDEENIKLIAGCGRRVCNTNIAIVNPDQLTRCPPDEIGEVWVSDPSVAQGYWQQEEETRQTFQAYIQDTGEGPFLRTGDLGFLIDEELFIGGRLKDLIIIRGANYYPQDIEQTLENSHPSLRPNCSAAFSMEIEGEERLIVMAEVERRYTSRRRQSDNEYQGENRRQSSDRRQQEIEPGNEPLERSPYDPQNIFRTITGAIAQYYQLQVYHIVLLRPGSIPKTSSGKIQRRACKRGLLENTLSIVDQWRLSLDIAPPIDQVHPKTFNPDSLEADLTHWLIQWLSNNLGLPVQSLELHESFLSYGLDSAKAIKLTHDLEMAFDYPVAQTFALDYPSIQSLIKDLNEKIFGKMRDNSKESKPVNSDQITELSGKPEEIIAKIEEISDQEVDLMLTQLLAEEENPQ